VACGGHVIMKISALDEGSVLRIRTLLDPGHVPVDVGPGGYVVSA
jgi:hypothetical protein